MEPNSSSVGSTIGVSIGDFKGHLHYHGAEKQPSKPPPFLLSPGQQNKLADFTGRRGELERLAELLIAPEDGRQARIVGLAGTGSIGKSALAFYFAEQRKADFPDGVFSS